MTETDRTTAEAVARKIVARGGGRVRRVVVIGSRAHGSALVESDLDLVVLLEVPASSPPWSGADFVSSSKRLQDSLGTTPLRPDVSVRTTDRYEEARGVIGGVEWLAEHEGVIVFASRPTRPPIVRTSPGDVRREFVSGWVHHALTPLERLVGGGEATGNPARLTALVFRRIVTALLVARQVPMPDVSLPALTAQLGSVDAELAGTLEEMIRRAADDPEPAARSAVQLVLSRLGSDLAQARVLVRARERLANCQAT